MLNQGAVGQLQYANRIVTTPYSLLVAGVSYVVFPAFARIAADRERFRPALLRTLRWSSVVAMPIGLILAPLGEPLAIVAFGERWSVAGEVTAAICLFIPAQTIAAEIGEGFKAAGIPAKRTHVNAIAVIAGGITMLALTPLIGLFGVGIGISVDAIAGAAVAISLAAARWRSLSAPSSSRSRPGRRRILVWSRRCSRSRTFVNAADHGTALGLLLLVAEALLGLAIYLVALRVLAPGLGRELLELVRTARRRPADERDLEGDEELLEDEGEPMLPG